MSRLGEKLLAIHGALAQAGIPHAFGGAIALAYCTQDPRGTSDLDINVFVPPAEGAAVAAALPEEVTWGRRDLAALKRAGQVRLWWDRTPVDLFLNTHTFHQKAAATSRTVPFEGREIPILSCESLAVFKAMFDRPKDWVDIDQMARVRAVDPPAIAATVYEILGCDAWDERLLALTPGEGGW